MAGYKAHTAAGLLSAVGYVLLLGILPGAIWAKTGGLLSSWQFVSALFIVSMLFSLWPDIDTNSRGQDIFFAFAFGLDIILISFGYLEAAAYLGLLAMTPIVGKHRGWTHTKLAMLSVPLPVVVVTYFYDPAVLPTALLVYGAAVAGYFSHLLLDGEITRKFRIKT